MSPWRVFQLYTLLLVLVLLVAGIVNSAQPEVVTVECGNCGLWSP